MNNQQALEIMERYNIAGWTQRYFCAACNGWEFPHELLTERLVAGALYTVKDRFFNPDSAEELAAIAEHQKIHKGEIGEVYFRQFQTIELAEARKKFA